MSGDPRLRANALEYLDNTLSGTIRRDVFVVIDDAPAEEKLHKADQLFGIAVEPPEDTLGRLLQADPEGDPASVHLAFAAIHSVQVEKIERYYPVLRSIALTDEDALLRETAQWVLCRLGLPERQSGDRIGNERVAGADEQQGGPDVSHMAQIEKVVFLQSVDLFGMCNAEQLVQLAAIANDHEFESGETIYKRDEPPDAMYSVIDGTVELTGADGGQVALKRGDTFGVVDILSGSLRTGNAHAKVTSRILVIDAEDFFDLLSNNIEIVRALFRQLTMSSIETTDGLL
jgi:hypothetical protein